MNFETFFKRELDVLRHEGRYRVFADLARQRGNLPRTLRHTADGPRDVTVWCSNAAGSARLSVAGGEVDLL